jgi:hypothetical protein
MHNYIDVACDDVNETALSDSLRLLFIDPIQFDHMVNNYDKNHI